MPPDFYDRPLDCLCDDAAEARPIHAVDQAGLEAWLAGLDAAQAAFLRASGFDGGSGQVALLPGPAGIDAAVLGLGAARGGTQGPHVFGSLPPKLPAGTTWRFGEGIADKAAATLGYCLGAYRFERLRREPRPAMPRLVVPDSPGVAAALSAARATWLARDLVNMPANLLGPADLAQAAQAVLSRPPIRGGQDAARNPAGAGAHVNVISGEELASRYPVVAAVAAGSARPGCVLTLHWQGSGAGEGSKLISICGKGVCFDSGGYDLKTADGMLRMKKDMAGAAIAVGLARMIMDADLEIRLELRIACVENGVSGMAMRPLDVLRTRSGLTVEVGNTDAEGRLVLCDLLSEAGEGRPDLLIDFATLTGAARTALGPDVAAMFGNDDALCRMFSEAGACEHDPVWRLPLWQGYNFWLDSDVADLNNVSSKTQAGAITAALFLQRFVAEGLSWLHLDVYGWNDQTMSGRPAGGEAAGLRAAFKAISRFVHDGR